MTGHLQVTEEVLHALAEKAAVVALESTIIAHGFPYPESLSVAQALHDAARDEGAVPAMIAIVRGEIRIGLDDALIEFVARSDDVEKCGIADIAAICARGANGATTVSASITLAGQAGIKMFATGGLGGVHRQRVSSENQPPDVSADLLALARTPITVVSSGAKMLLDLPATVEALESLGVPVLGHRTSHFPGFYMLSSEIPLRHSFDNVAALALAVQRQDEMGLPSGVLVCNSPPDDVALDPRELECWIEQALAEAKRDGISGSDVTPYVLDTLHRLSAGRTVACNKALAVENAALAGRLAHALALPKVQ